MPLLGPIISEIVTRLDGVYLRATDDEANIDLDNIDLQDKTVFIYNNLPTVTNERGEHGTWTSRYWPAEISILRLADMDDNGQDGDVIRLACLNLADKFWDNIQNHPSVSKVLPLEGYELEFSEHVKLYDKVLTGLSISFEFPIDRETYECFTNP